MAVNPIYIPTFIGSITYAPVRVLPHIYFYNGTKDTNTYFIGGYGATTSSLNIVSQSAFPYFDNYSGNTPTTESLSLLFNNEAPVYGQAPTASLYTTYWEKYISLLYNPRTRLINCEGIIPLANYFKMELNDIVEWRGNYYHLRAINDYNLKNGECKIQLLGPILEDVITNLLPELDCNFTFTQALPTPTTTAPPKVLYQVTIGNGINRTTTYTDYNNVVRTFNVSATAALRTFRFVAIKGTVSFNNSLGCTLTTITDPIIPNFINYSIFFGPSQLPTYYINYQDENGAIGTGTNYFYPTSVCAVSGTFTATGGLDWPVGYWRLTNTGPCGPPTTSTTTIAATTTTLAPTTTTTLAPTTTTTTISASCSTWQIINSSPSLGGQVTYVPCSGAGYRDQFIPASSSITLCVKGTQIQNVAGYASSSLTNLGTSCTSSLQNCISYTITNSGGAQYSYGGKNCSNCATTLYNINGGQTVVRCFVSGTFTTSFPSFVTATAGANCNISGSGCPI